MRSSTNTCDSGFTPFFFGRSAHTDSPFEPKKKTGYETDRFLEFYKKGLDHIIALNRKGTDIAEIYAKIILTKILTPLSTSFVDLQSPAGAGISVAVYNYDGDVYASDESRMLAEMGDSRFRLGNVHRDDYRTIFGSDQLVAITESSVVESLPGCCDCAFQPYCGSDPVFQLCGGRRHRWSPAYERILPPQHGSYSLPFLCFSVARTPSFIESFLRGSGILAFRKFGRGLRFDSSYHQWAPHWVSTASCSSGSEESRRRPRSPNYSRNRHRQESGRLEGSSELSRYSHHASR